MIKMRSYDFEMICKMRKINKNKKFHDFLYRLSNSYAKQPFFSCAFVFMCYQKTTHLVSFNKYISMLCKIICIRVKYNHVCMTEIQK